MPMYGSSSRYDNTGGPRGQLACHPAAAQFVLDNAANLERCLVEQSACFFSPLVGEIHKMKQAKQVPSDIVGD